MHQEAKKQESSATPTEHQQAKSALLLSGAVSEEMSSQLTTENMVLEEKHIQILNDLLLQKPQAISSWQDLSVENQLLIYKEIQKKALAKTLSVEQQRFILKAMPSIVAKTKWSKLDFIGFGTSLTDDLLEPILIAAESNLQQLYIADSKEITNKSLTKIFSHNFNLYDLSARGVNWTRFSLIKLKYLEKLDLSGSTIHTLTGKARHLSSLQLTNCQQLRTIGERGLFEDEAFAAPQLKELDLTGCRSLNDLYLAKNLFFSIVVNQLTLTNSTISTITLQTESGDWVHVPDFVFGSFQEGVKGLRCAPLPKEFADSKSLTLSLDNLKKLANYLAHDDFFIYLDLSDNCLGNQGVQILAQVFKTNTKLKFLNLSGNKIDSIGLQFLTENLKTNMALIELIIQNNQFNMAGLQLLEQMMSANTTLINLEYTDCKPAVAVSKIFDSKSEADYSAQIKIGEHLARNRSLSTNMEFKDTSNFKRSLAEVKAEERKAELKATLAGRNREQLQLFSADFHKWALFNILQKPPFQSSHLTTPVPHGVVVSSRQLFPPAPYKEIQDLLGKAYIAIKEAGIVLKQYSSEEYALVTQMWLHQLRFCSSSKNLHKSEEKLSKLLTSISSLMQEMQTKKTDLLHILFS